MKLLIIDDEENLLKLLKINLKRDGREIETAKTAGEGIRKYRDDLFDVVLCDIGLPDKDGIEVLKNLKEIKSQTPVIMITAHGSVDTAITAMKNGAYDYIQKPFEAEEIEFVIERALRETRLLEDYSRLRTEVSSKYNFSNILGSSSAMKKLFERMRKAAETKTSVLITGESGTGKELIAKAIHFNSPRRSKAFVVVDCASIPVNLVESELFGHVKGAFTGADTAKKGLCEEANHGTLFLDEIGELPLELQAKLLRLLQEGTIRRVGDVKPIQLDLRIVSATNRDLEEESKNNRFRQDLYYRLNVVPLVSPALRERSGDIPLLAQYFLKKYSQEYKRKTQDISPAVMNRLISFEWPGNVRQLENVIEQMVVMSEGRSLELDTLPPPLSNSDSIQTPSLSETEWDLKSALSKVQSYTEEYMIRRALERTEHNKTKAAELLGISRRSLISKTQDYKIDEKAAS